MKAEKKCVSFILTGLIIFTMTLTVFSGCTGTKAVREVPASVENIKKKWDSVKLPGAGVWVAYDRELDARGEVDFVKGRLSLETVLPSLSENIPEMAEKKIILHALRVLTTESPDRERILKDQLRNRKGETLTDSNIDSYIETEIIPKLRKEKTYVAGDGVERVKLTAAVDLVPDHIEVRARHYLGPVRHFAEKLSLSPALIMAMIHTESHFNPLAKSPGGALGLMQLIPRYGAKEAYAFLYGADRILPESYFYDPVKNIELGTAYYHLLKTRHFDDIRDHIRKRYVAVCAYNWGPGRLRNIVRTYPVQQMNRKDLFSLLQKKIPAETAEYLKDVITRSQVYEKLLSEK